ncbi:atrial natriuretic peptide receptor 1-like, partial [Notechis scutatus]
VYVCCPPDIFRGLMLQAHREGLTAGEYAFFYMDLFGSSLQSSRFPDPTLPWRRGDGNDGAAREAYKAVMLITYTEPQNPEYHSFLQDIKRTSQEQFNFTMEDGLEDFIVGAFYDGVMLYGQAVNETLALGGSITDGLAITLQMRNRTFQGITGLLRIDQNGDREMDHSLWDLDPASGVFEVVAIYNGTTKKIETIPGKKIHWPGNAVPREVPFCGFENENPLCQKASFSLLEILALVMTLLLFGIILTAFFAYR